MPFMLGATNDPEGDRVDTPIRLNIAEINRLPNDCPEFQGRGGSLVTQFPLIFLLR